MVIVPKEKDAMTSKMEKEQNELVPIAALKEKKIFAPLTFEGSCSRDLFEMWLKECLRPQLEEGDIIIIDNASFHKGESIEEIVKVAGCELWYLPTYSPDLNKRCNPAEETSAGSHRNFASILINY